MAPRTHRALTVIMAVWTTVGAPYFCLGGATECCAPYAVLVASTATIDECCRETEGECCPPSEQRPTPRSCDGCGLICGTAAKLPDEMRGAALAPSLMLLPANSLTPRASEIIGAACHVELPGFGWGARALALIALLI